MEIAKFVITCVLATITVAGAVAGIWKAYNKKVTEKIKQTEEAAAKNVEFARKEASEKVKAAELAARDSDEKLRNDFEKRITKLEDDVSDLQKTINDDIRDRLGNIEGEMKGMNNILKSIQNWFIANTPRE